MFNINDFDDFDAVWQDFARAHPQLRLSGTRWSALHFRRIHRKRLIDSGVVLVMPGGRMLAHKEKLPALALQLCLDLPETIAAKTKPVGRRKRRITSKPETLEA